MWRKAIVIFARWLDYQLGATPGTPLPRARDLKPPKQTKQ